VLRLSDVGVHVLLLLMFVQPVDLPTVKNPNGIVHTKTAD
jgi:hypothetical protein